MLFLVSGTLLNANEIKLVSSSMESIELSYKPEYKGNEIININGQSFIKPIFGNCDYVLDNYNNPMLFVKSVLITVPSPDNFKIENVNVEISSAENGIMAPTPTINFYDGVMTEEYKYIPENYNNFENKNWVNLEYIGLSGHRHIARVDFVVAQYNLTNNVIERPINFYVKIKFNNKTDGKQLSYADQKYLKNDLEITINHNETRGWLVDRKAEKNKDAFQSELLKLNDISDGNWYKLTINKEGVYRITASNLESLGIKIPTSQLNTIKIYGQSGKPMSEKLSTDFALNEQEIIVNTNNDGSLESIVFYASGPSGFEMDSFSNIYLQRHYLNYMDTKNSYLLTYGKAEGKRANPIPQENETTTSKPTTYKASIFVEEDKYMPGTMGTGLQWFGESILNNNSLIDNLHNFNRNGNVEYVFSVGHTAPNSQNITIYQGSNQIFSRAIDNGTPGDYTNARVITHYVTAPASQIASDNRSVLRFNYSGLSLYPYHNFYEIHYPSDMIPINNEITLYSNIADYNSNEEIVEYSINGFSGSRIYGFDVSDMSSPKLLTNIANTGGMYIFKHKENKSNIRKYFISATTITPIIESITLLNLRDVNDNYYANSDVIVISPDEFLESARNYAEYRTKQSGYKISVVPINKIYAEFSYCRLDLVAIRHYIQYAYENWDNPPSYIVLWGTGHYDFREIEGHRNYIPAHQRTAEGRAKLTINNDNFTISADASDYTTDDFYVCLNAEDNNYYYPTISIGRVPISSNSQGNIYVAKLDQYENQLNKGSWRRNVMLHADDAPTTGKKDDGSGHVSSCERITNALPLQFMLNKVYIHEYPVEILPGNVRRISKATEELFNQINLVGNIIYSFMGHGNTTTLTHEKTFVRDMLPQLNNEDKLFFFSAGSCDVGKYDQIAGTLAADLVLLPKTGAIGAFAASRPSSAGYNDALLPLIIKNLLNKNQYGNYYTMGEASRIAKNNVSYRGQHPMYILFGDPCVRLVAPELNVQIDEINETQIIKNMEPIQVEGMTYLRIKGKIVTESSAFVSNFNGIINVVLNEPKVPVTNSDDLGNKFNYIKNGATLNSGVFQVINGEFYIELLIPGDISFSENKSLLYFYASSDDDRYAIGINNDILINGIYTGIPDDGNGPEIIIHLDSKLFKSGDTVSRNPLLMVDLWDETGINTTGLGIGHKIEARLDNNPTTIDLTPNYTPSLIDPKAGEVQRYLGELSPGRHSITVRAWDVFNNYTDASVDFIIPTERDEGILRASFAPNPAYSADKIGIAVYYSVNPPIDANIIVYDNSGRVVSNFDAKFTADGYSIVNFEPENNVPLCNGTYYYYIKFKYNQTKTSHHWCEKYGTLGVIFK
ncbi:MAG: type IX secretion system sortase PorU [Bacteroidetes bacterium]|nr:type IX secretion system sortase PorU [Bacteroidota bacterium]